MYMKLRSVLITGASSGIGYALAIRLAKPGVTLHLSGRRSDALAGLAEKCCQLGANVYTKIIDVCNQQEMDEWIKSAGQLDLVLACAGISFVPHVETHAHVIPEPIAQCYKIMQTNMNGVLNTVLPAIEVMQRQECNSEHIRGRIAAIASIASFFTSAWAPSYCASKAAVDRFMVASGMGWWKKCRIQLTSVCCGFVETPMTQKNKFYMPGKISADKAAQLILEGIEGRKRRVIFPVWLAIIARILDLFPVSFLEKIYLPYLQEQDRHK